MNTKNASNSGEGRGAGSVQTLLTKTRSQIRGFSTQISHPTIFVIVALILVASSSFALGRLSVMEQNREPIRIEYEDQTASVENAPALDSTSVSGGVVASKTGAVYYFPWCAGALKISEANKVWFASEEMAKSTGLRPAANCKGMIK